jgi:hypothetical protein
VIGLEGERYLGAFVGGLTGRALLAEPPWRIPEEFCNLLAVPQRLRHNATSSLRARRTCRKGFLPCDTGSERSALSDGLLQFVEQLLRSHEIGTRETLFEPGCHLTLHVDTWKVDA